MEPLGEVVPNTFQTLPRPDDGLDDVLGDVQVVVPLLNSLDVLQKTPRPALGVPGEAGNKAS